MVDARKFLLNTDYPMDEIVFKTSGQLPVDGGSVNIPHTLGFVPLVILQFSYTPDFSICQESTERPSDLYPNNFPYIGMYTATSTNINVAISDFSFSGKTWYYRVLCFAPSDSTAKVAAPTTNDLFIINTDYNYSKLLSSGIANENTTVYYNLGYEPQVMWWMEVDGVIRTPNNYGFMYTQTDNATPELYTDRVYFPVSLMSGTTKRFHYRIYIDEQS